MKVLHALRFAPLLLGCLTILPSHAATLYVPSQYPTIQAGINAARPGDTVLVSDGVYNGPGNVDLDFGGKAITLTSVHGLAATVIDCQAGNTNPHRGFYFHSGETRAAVVSGFTVENGISPPQYSLGGGGGGTIYSSPTITNCSFVGNGTDGLDVDGSPLIATCSFTGNQQDGVDLGPDGSPVIINCTFAGNAGDGVYATGQLNVILPMEAATRTGKSLGDGPTITNCSFSGNLHGIGTFYNRSLTITNCVLWDVYGEIWNKDGFVTLSHCDVRGGFEGVGNISADPLFLRSVGPSGPGVPPHDPGDQHLRPGSPCAGAGSAVGAPPTDKDGNTRPGPSSIGAYELLPHSWVATSLSVAPDGASHLLWDNLSGLAAFWRLDAVGRYVSQQQYGPFAGWAAQSVATGPDGYTHVLWVNASGQVALWRLDSGNNFVDQQNYGPFLRWSAVSLSVGPDGYAHLLWTNLDGTAAFWRLDSGNNFVDQQQYGPFAGWAAKSVFTGPDLKTRALWTNLDGTAAFWRLDSQNRFLDQQQYGPFAGWNVTSLSVGADDTTRVTWNSINGTAAFWRLDSQNRFLDQQQYGPFTGWSAQALAGGAPDASSRALWENVSGQIALWNVDATGRFLSQQQYGPF